MSKPKILLFDIETAPIEAFVWGLYDVNVQLNQIKHDWCILSWAAKWLDSDKIMYQDQRDAKDIRNDKKLLKDIWNLLNETDIVITQNGKSFDSRRLNARFVIHGYKPPSSYKHIDTKQLAQKHFGFTSYKLEYMCKALNTKHQKLKHPKFEGQELWTQCLKRNPKAWAEMEKYNKHDVLCLEDLYKKIAPWGLGITYNVFTESGEMHCNCGSKEFIKWGFNYTKVGKYQRYMCKNCGAEYSDRRNELSKDLRKNLKVGM